MTIKRFAVLLVQNSLLMVALMATVAISALTTMRVVLQSQEVLVPSLLDRRIPEAGALAARHGLSLRVEGKRHDSRVAPERVVAQAPPPGSTLKTHRSVRVWLSLGARRLVVPGVEGESLRTGRLTLEQSRALVGRVVEVDHWAREGTILSQRPPAGEADAVGEGVSLLVSRGTVGVDYVMPDLIGREAGAVLQGLRQAGLKVAEVRYRSYPGVAPGIVLRQYPAAGRRASRRSSVSLEVSRAAGTESNEPR